MSVNGADAGAPPGQGRGQQQERNDAEGNNRENQNRGGAGRGNNRRGGYQRNQQRGPPQIRFEGREPTLAGYIYDSPRDGERNPDQYIKTTKEIENYVGQTYGEHTGEFVQSVKDLILDDPAAPAAPGQDPADFEIWKLDLRDFRAKLKAYNNFRAGLYNTVFGQCTPALQDCLQSHQLFGAADQDRITLLTLIKEIVYTFEAQSNLADALTNVKEYFYTLSSRVRVSSSQCR